MKGRGGASPLLSSHSFARSVSVVCYRCCGCCRVREVVIVVGLWLLLLLLLLS